MIPSASAKVSLPPAGQIPTKALRPYTGPDGVVSLRRCAGLVVRPVGPDDAMVVAELWRQFGRPNRIATVRDRLARISAEHRVNLLGLEEQQTLVGVIALTIQGAARNAPPIGWMSGPWVDASRSGFDRENVLMRAGEFWLSQKGCSRVEWMGRD